MRNVLRSGQFYGKIKKSNRIPGLVLAETVYPPRLHVPRHSHQDAYFCLVLRGSYTEVYGAKTRACTALTLAFHPPAEVHSETFDDSEVRSFNVGVETSFVSRIREHSDVLDRPIHLQSGGYAALAIRLYNEFRHMDASSPLAIEGLVLELLAMTARSRQAAPRGKSDRWLRSAKDLLHARFRESLSLTEIADEVGVHPVHLAREFRRHYYSTIGEYIRGLRIEHACASLSDSGNSLSEVALHAGFFDQSHFCKVFRDRTGMTPREYRSVILGLRSTILRVPPHRDSEGLREGNL